MPGLRITYDPSCRAAYVYVEPGLKVRRTIEIGSDLRVMADLSAGGSVHGVEILDVGEPVVVFLEMPRREVTLDPGEYL